MVKTKSTLKDTPQHVDPNLWYYEEPTGIDIIINSLDPAVKIIHIPWRMIRASLRRKDKKSRRK